MPRESVRVNYVVEAVRLSPDERRLDRYGSSLVNWIHVVIPILLALLAVLVAFVSLELEDRQQNQLVHDVVQVVLGQVLDALHLLYGAAHVAWLRSQVFIAVILLVEARVNCTRAFEYGRRRLVDGLVVFLVLRLLIVRLLILLGTLTAHLLASRQ